MNIQPWPTTSLCLAELSPVQPSPARPRPAYASQTQRKESPSHPDPAHHPPTIQRITQTIHPSGKRHSRELISLASRAVRHCTENKVSMEEGVAAHVSIQQLMLIFRGMPRLLLVVEAFLGRPLPLVE